MAYKGKGFYFNFRDYTIFSFFILFWFLLMAKINQTFHLLHSNRRKTRFFFSPLKFEISRFFFISINTCKTDFCGPIRNKTSRIKTIVEIKSPRIRKPKHIDSGFSDRTRGPSYLSSRSIRTSWSAESVYLWMTLRTW